MKALSFSFLGFYSVLFHPEFLSSSQDSWFSHNALSQQNACKTSGLFLFHLKQEVRNSNFQAGFSHWKGGAFPPTWISDLHKSVLSSDGSSYMLLMTQTAAGTRPPSTLVIIGTVNMHVTPAVTLCQRGVFECSTEAVASAAAPSVDACLILHFFCSCGGAARHQRGGCHLFPAGGG